MIIKPRIRGFICTTAHPTGCAANVHAQIDHVRGAGPIENAPQNALILGCSGGYGLASRIVAAFGGGAATLGVSFEKEPSENKTGTAGWYNNRAFEREAHAAGLYARTLNADAFADATRAQVIDIIREDMQPIDLLVYSLASPVREHPRTGELHRSAIKPLREVLHMKTLNVDKAEVHEVDLVPATQAELADTVKVMGGEDWEYWVEALQEAGVLAPGFRTVAYTYIGSELTWPIYWEATLGAAKEDVDRAAIAIRERLAALDGDARVAVLKAVVTQASSAIPVVPLYNSILFRVMKEAGVHENCIQHIDRLFREQLLAEPARQRRDEVGRLRVDERELDPDIQAEVRRRFEAVTTDNLEQLADLPGYRADFLRIFGFGVEGVDYEAEVSPLGD